MLRGQVSLFLVIGVITVSLVVGIVAITAPEPTSRAPPPKPYSVYSDTLLEECLEDISEEAIGTVLGTGGYASSDIGSLGEFAEGGVAFAILRPHEREEGHIIDTNYFEPGITVPMNRYGKIKLPPLEGRYSFEEAIRTEASGLTYRCAFGGEIEHLSTRVQIGESDISMVYELRNTRVGSPQQVIHQSPVPLRQLHEELSVALERSVYYRGVPIETSFSEAHGIDYTDGLLTIEHEPSGHELRVRIQDRFPLLLSTACPPHHGIENPDPSVPAAFSSTVCSGGELDTIRLEAGSDHRDISMAVVI